MTELVSALIPTSPLLLPATLALVARGILLTLAVTAAILLRRRHADIVAGMKIETADGPSGKTPGRVSSPTPATWPFPASLASKHQSGRGNCPANQSTPPDLPPIPTRTHNADKDTRKFGKQNFIFLPLVLMTAQIFATLSAALNVAASMLMDGAINRTNQPLPHILLVSAVCTLLWSIAVLILIQSKSNSFSTIFSLHSWHPDKYSPLNLFRALRRSKWRRTVNRAHREAVLTGFRVTILHCGHQSLRSIDANPILYSISFPCEIRLPVRRHRHRHRLSRLSGLVSMKLTWDGTETRKLVCNTVSPRHVQLSREDGPRERRPVSTERNVSSTKILLAHCCPSPKPEARKQM